MDLLGAGYAAALFGGYAVLWRSKRRRQRRDTGVDPEVLRRAARPLQRWFARMLRVLTGTLAVLGVGHAARLAGAPFAALGPLDARWADHLGLAVGVSGLALCALAQRTMGAAWRVGIDERTATPLVQHGIFARVRNPTYLGLFLVNGGLWLIWPSTSIAAFAALFFVVIEAQVRCEEEHLEALHGEAYRAYQARSWRYLPFVY